MKLLGFQIPNYTFPGVTNDKLFDHVVMLATTAEKAGFDVGGPDRVADQAQKLLEAGLDGLIFNMPHMEDPEAIELAGQTLAALRQPAAAR
jgi:alkanesulfonate monooxygenase SsuD/methylene tetrahydromethanopterin reductase-like flavin-dependent oxidoreductase (luciferase family)